MGESEKEKKNLLWITVAFTSQNQKLGIRETSIHGEGLLLFHLVTKGIFKLSCRLGGGERKRDRQADRDKEKETDWHRYTEIHKQTQRERTRWLSKGCSTSKKTGLRFFFFF